MNKLEESRLRCQRFPSYFHHMICTNNFYSFYSNNSRCKYGYFPTHRIQSFDQVPPPLVICLDENWDKKVAMDLCFFFHPGYLVRWKTPHWTHPLWCVDMHLSGAYVCFPAQGRLLYFPKFLHLFSVFILSEVVALHKLGHPIIL